MEQLKSHKNFHNFVSKQKKIFSKSKIHTFLQMHFYLGAYTFIPHHLWVLLTIWSALKCLATLWFVEWKSICIRYFIGPLWFSQWTVCRNLLSVYEYILVHRHMSLLNQQLLDGYTHKERWHIPLVFE